MTDRYSIDSDFDPVSRETAFKFEGEPYRLSFDFEAIYSFYVATGVNPLFQAIGEDPSSLLALLYCGLHKYHSDISMELLKKWLSAVPVMRAFYLLLTKAFEALKEDPPKEGEGETENPPIA